MTVVVLLTVIAWFVIPRVAGWEPQVVLTGSMEPALPVGSVAFVAPRDADKVRVGDIITFQHPQSTENLLVSHRVVEVTGDAAGGGLSFRTKGDANGSPDLWTVPAENLVGVIEFQVPFVGHLTRRVRTPAGLALLVGLPGLLIIIGEVRSIAKELRKRRNERNERTHQGLRELATEPGDPAP